VNRKTRLGLILIACSYAQAFYPRRLFEEPSFRVFGYPLFAGNALAFSASLFTAGVIVLGEGVCQRFGGVSLFSFATATPQRLLRVALSAVVCGLALELTAQWLGKLWIYPYWATWFYLLVVLPGFTFYWLSIVESYLAVKAVLDHRWNGHCVQRQAFVVPHKGVVVGFAFLALSAGLFGQWYAEHGWAFAVVRPVSTAPPFFYVLLAFVGGWLVAEWVLARRRSGSLLASVLSGYWAPAVAVLASSASLSLLMETQNTIHHYWRYLHFPGPDVPLTGVRATVFATWPLHCVVFLMLAGVLTPELAQVFWRKDVRSPTHR
jgi:hypothetical protein